MITLFQMHVNLAKTLSIFLGQIVIIRAINWGVFCYPVISIMILYVHSKYAFSKTSVVQIKHGFSEMTGNNQKLLPTKLIHNIHQHDAQWDRLNYNFIVGLKKVLRKMARFESILVYFLSMPFLVLYVFHLCTLVFVYFDLLLSTFCLLLVTFLFRPAVFSVACLCIPLFCFAFFSYICLFSSLFVYFVYSFVLSIFGLVFQLFSHCEWHEFCSRRWSPNFKDPARITC